MGNLPEDKMAYDRRSPQRGSVSTARKIGNAGMLQMQPSHDGPAGLLCIQAAWKEKSVLGAGVYEDADKWLFLRKYGIKIRGKNVYLLEEEDKEGILSEIGDGAQEKESEPSVFSVKEDEEYLYRLLTRRNELPADMERLSKEIERAVVRICYKNESSSQMEEAGEKLSDMVEAERKSVVEAYGQSDRRVAFVRSHQVEERGKYDKHLREAVKERSAALERLKSFSEEKTKFSLARKDGEKGIRMFLRSKGMLLLQEGKPLAGLFPSAENLTMKRKSEMCLDMKERYSQERFRALIERANHLVRKYGLYEGGIFNKRPGCICIMYYKEIDQKTGEATYHPVFGVSGYMKGEGSVQKGLELLGFSMSGEELEAFGGMERPERAAWIRRYLAKCDALAIKRPTVQAQLELFQYQKGDTSVERWTPVNCAEPAIVMAVAELTSATHEMILSVPFEGFLKDGCVRPKYTCGRCAISEYAFAAVPSEGSDTLKIGRIKIRMRDHKDRGRMFGDTLYREGVTEGAYSGSRQKAMEEELDLQEDNQILHR